MWYDTLRFTIHTPELAMVRFVVEDYDKTTKNDFIGQYTLPLSCMQQGEDGKLYIDQSDPVKAAALTLFLWVCLVLLGYRHIHLLSRDGTSIPPSSLFVHIRISELE